MSVATNDFYSLHVKPEPLPDPDISNFRFTFSPNPYRLPPSWPQGGTDSPVDPQYYYPSPMSYSDGYDGAEGFDDIADLSLDTSAIPSSSYAASTIAERNVRRRSSKACDQCRKSKCKCERGSPNEACKNCLMLGTACTFLGPSRKRGPPKGYIDAIEARLHQTEALLGIMLSTTDTRAKSLLRDIAKDPLAKQIINRVDNSPYGVKGRKREDIALSVGKLRSGHSSETSLPGQKLDSAPLDLTSTHPSNEWQDRVSTMLNGVAASSSSQSAAPSHNYSSPKSQSSDENISPTSRRQRRRVGDEDYQLQGNDITNSASGSAVSLHDSLVGSSTKNLNLVSSPARAAFVRTKSGSVSSSGWVKDDRRSSSVDSRSYNSESEDELLGAVGQLSLNEEEQVRYHGKASGLYLLGNKERVDRRNEGGIWRFPKARVWPPLQSGSQSLTEDEFVSQLPPRETQEHLLDLYFTYVHPFFPVVHKRAFFDAFKHEDDSTSHDEADQNNTSPFNRRRRHIPSLLLLSMFALASRYDPSTTPLPSDPSIMWSAGDEYLDRAKIILDSTYSSSKPATVQALLMMGYREVGIGAMAQAWTYIGMGIRMAQDLGMHRVADGWKREGLGGRLFSEWELAERKRIWFGCVILDKYISSYIGRPLMIFESDFDTMLPSVDDPEETEDWSVEIPLGGRSPPVPGRLISCFNASAVLSSILGRVVQSVYAIRPPASRHAESTILESMLDKWYLELPGHLRCEVGGSGATTSTSSSKQSPTPLPNVLTLHLQYWCTVLLLHRPFITHLLHRKGKQTEDEDPETKARVAKSYELCHAAANHISSLVALYQEKYLIERCPVFLCYYVFTASIMHDAHVSVHPEDPQGRLGFSKCFSALRAMRVVWPAAGRAFDLFFGAKNGGGSSSAHIYPRLVELTHPPLRDRHKRVAEQAFDDTVTASPHTVPSHAHRQGLPPQGSFDYGPASRRQSLSNRGHTQAQYSNQPAQATGQPPASPTIFTGLAGYMPSQSSLASPSSPASVGYPSSAVSNPGYWPGMSGLNGSLSTAVLPPLYSSGYLDDMEGQSRSMHSPIDPHLHQPTQQQREFEKYSTGGYALPPSPYLEYPPGLSQMGQYDVQETQQPQQQQHQPQPQPQHSHQLPPPMQQQSSQVYIPHYNIYNSQLYNGRTG